MRIIILKNIKSLTIKFRGSSPKNINGDILLELLHGLLTLARDTVIRLKQHLIKQWKLEPIKGDSNRII